MSKATPLPVLLDELRRLDARIEAEGDRLRVSAPSGAVPEDLRAQMTRRREELIEFLRHAGSAGEESVVARFERQVDATPDAPAVITAIPARSTDPRPLTYRELDRRANRLAEQLGVIGVVANGTVGLLLHRSADFVVAALATLKIGAAYVPIDPAFPRPRQELLLREAGVTALITRTEPGMVLPEARARVVCLKAWESELARRSDRRPGRVVAPEAIACLTYSSEPAAQVRPMPVPHRDIVRDASAFELWAGLLHGGGVVLFPDLTEVRPSGRLRRWNPAQRARPEHHQSSDPASTPREEFEL
jgi:non-ribosomal peptide synthetase component F